MPVCPVCHQEVVAAEARAVPSDGGELQVHAACFKTFSSLVKEALRAASVQPSATGLDRLARVVSGRLVLTHRNFPNEQMPFLVYLAAQKDPVVVAETYRWAAQNELRIANPALQILRLKKKGLVATYENEGERCVVITDAGRKAIEEFAASVT